MSFSGSITESIALVEECGMLGQPNSSAYVPRTIGSQLRKLTYAQQWEKMKSNYWFHILMEDESFILFNGNSFSYWMCPYKCVSFDEYVDEIYGPEWRESEDLVTEFKSDQELIEEFDKKVETETIERTVTPIRFDLQPGEYKKETHPVCHMHIGFDNEIRIAVKKVMTPFSFTCFIIRQNYPKKWAEFLAVNPGYLDEVSAKIKTGLDPITRQHPDKWCSTHEEALFYLG